MSRPLLPLTVPLLLAACASTSEPPRATARPLDPPPAVVQRSLETLASGEVADWTDAAGRGGGTVQPVRTFRTAGGFCREYALTVSGADGRGRAWREVACRDPDGVWRMPAVEA
jgi:hypothetical protein